MRRGMWLVVLIALFPIACGSNGDHEPVSFVTVDTDADWSPDGRLIAFASSRGAGGLYLVRPDGTGMRQLLRGGVSNVEWSPDGGQIAFEDHGIYVVGAAGGSRRRVLKGQRFALPAWSPDGLELAVVKSEADLSNAIYVVTLDGSGLRRLLPPRVRKSDASWETVAASETEPAWSPDGRRIAFQAGNGHIVVEAAGGGPRRELTRGYEPAWSPDGRLIAFQYESGLWVTNADGSGDTRRLVPNGGDASWSPDSQSLVFEVRHWLGRYWRRPQSLSVVDASGENLRKLTFGGSSLDNADWRGDVPPVP